MRRMTLLVPLAILGTSSACSSHRSLPVSTLHLAAHGLVEPSLVILEHIQAGARTEAEWEIEQLAVVFPGAAGVEEVQGILRIWLRRQVERQEAVQPSADVTSAGPDLAPPVQLGSQASPQTPPEAPPQTSPQAPPQSADQPMIPGKQGLVPPSETLDALKEEGMRLYGEGKVAEALECWRRVILACPTDEEAQRLAARARTVLGNQSNP